MVKMSEFLPLSTSQIITPTIVQRIAETWNPNSKVLSYQVTKEKDIKGFLSIMYSVEIEVLVKDGEEQGHPTTLSVMFKAIPRNPIRLGMIQDGKYYLKETQMYENILPELMKGTSSGEVSLFPKSILTFYNGVEDFIVMENLKPMGYKLIENGKELDLTHAKLVVKEMAKFHSLSFAKWKGSGRDILETYPFLRDNLWKDPDAESLNAYFKGHIQNTFTDLSALLEKNNRIMERKRLENFMNQSNIYVKMHQLCSLPVDNQFPSVICHGDPWFNNILFKYNSEGIPVEIKFLDYQLSKVGSRILDLSYLFYTSLEIGVLNNHMNELLELYHRAFVQQISKLELRDEKLEQIQTQSYGSFLEEWNEYKFYGLIMGLYLLPPMNANPQNIPDFESLTRKDLEDRNEGNGSSKFCNFLNKERVLPKLINLIENHLDEE